MPLVWEGEKFLSELEKRTYQRLERASIFLENQIIMKLGRAQPPGPPGGPPHMLSGELARSITHQMMDATTSRVGVEAISPANIYALIHELGGDIFPRKAKALRFKTADGQWHTVKHVRMPMRPYLRPTLDENMEEITKLIAGPGTD